jgi:hypothetical protein
MDAVKPEAATDEAGAVTAAVEEEIRDFVEEMSRRTGTAAGRSVEKAALLVEREGATSIGEIEKLIAELQIARNYLQSEGEHLKRELSRYEHLSQSAFGSVRGMAQCLGEWRESGHRPRGRPGGLAKR